jgi:hypothetical protein
MQNHSTGVMKQSIQLTVVGQQYTNYMTQIEVQVSFTQCSIQ